MAPGNPRLGDGVTQNNHGRLAARVDGMAIAYRQQLAFPQQLEQRTHSLLAMSACGAVAHQHDLIATAHGNEDAPPRRQTLEHGRREPLGGHQPHPVAHRLVRRYLMRQADQAVVIALDLVALDAPVEDDQVGASAWTQIELLNDPRIRVAGVKARGAGAQRLADVPVEHGMKSSGRSGDKPEASPGSA